MTKRELHAAIAAALVAAHAAMAQSPRRTPVVEVVERVRPAVVNLTARQVQSVRRLSPFDDFFGDLFPELRRAEPRRFTSQSLGSGVVVTADGLIVTNEHVIEGAAEIRVRFASGSEQDAKVVGSDSDADLALLRVPGSALPHLALATSDDLLIGETVIAIGNPLGLENTVTVGVLSARDRTVRSPGTNRTYTDFLQTDASINPGNSGGALVNLEGKLHGINPAIVGEAQGIGFAIPARRARRVVNDLLRYGQVQPAWLGVFVKNRSSRGGGDEAGAGVEVAVVMPDSPASSAGLVRGAVLRSANGRSLASRDDYATAVAQLAPGDRVTFVIEGDGSTQSVALQATRPPSNVGEQVLSRFVGIRLAVRGTGLEVGRVASGTPGDEAGLAAGDGVRAINGETVKTLADVNRVLARDYTRSSVLLVVQRGAFAYNLTFPLTP